MPVSKLFGHACASRKKPRKVGTSAVCLRAARRRGVPPEVCGLLPVPQAHEGTRAGATACNLRRNAVREIVFLYFSRTLLRQQVVSGRARAARVIRSAAAYQKGASGAPHG